jgi:[protein-PII] uridylyltransferase
MSHLAFRRDFDDPNLILRFARSVQNLPNLDRLCLLTFCDIKAVGPDAMTSWKATLLELLYLKTREALLEGAERDEGATSGGVASGINRVRDSVRRELKSDEDRRIAGLFMDSLPSRYLLATAPERIAYHFNLWRRLEREGVVLDERLLEREGLSEVTLLTTDSPGLFSRMAGIFAAHNINILSAELTVSRQGIAIQSFRVTDHQGEPVRDPEKWGDLAKNLQDVLSGRERIEALVAEKFRPSLFRKKTAGRLPSKIDVDNEVSAFYTVIDIYAHDRMGLLYQITATMAALGLYVEVSKISTKVDQVSDTFYVKDIFGQKLTDEGRVKKIRERLLAVVDSEPTPDWRVEA